MNNILKTAQNWVNQDPDNETRQELQALIDSNDTAELEKRFSGRLQFGTAALLSVLMGVKTRYDLHKIPLKLCKVLALMPTLCLTYAQLLVLLLPFAN